MDQLVDIGKSFDHFMPNAGYTLLLIYEPKTKRIQMKLSNIHSLPKHLQSTTDGLLQTKTLFAKGLQAVADMLLLNKPFDVQLRKKSLKLSPKTK